MTAAALEEKLGSADRATGAGSWGEAVRADEAEAFPEELVAALGPGGFLAHFVPAALGGQLRSLEDSAALVRAVARRDLTAAIALGQAFLGSVPVWLRGEAHQKRRQAEVLLGGRLAALALTEEAHGADIMASEVRATRAGTDFALTGTKWLINNGTRGELLTLFARTDAAGGLNGFSLFQVDRARAELGTLPKQPTHGIRGADISGVVLNETKVPGAAVVGNVGSGVETALLALQVTRVGCGAFALGAADTALRVATRFALERQLYGGTVAELPHARDALAAAYVDLLVCESLTRGAARGLHTTPGEASVSSAVVKFLVPTLCESLARSAATVLGARHYLRQGYAQGVFQKMLRDLAVVPLFDGSTAVNLEGVATQLLRWEPVRRGGAQAADGEALALRFGGGELPPFDGDGLALMALGRDEVLDGLPHALFELAQANAKLLPVANRLAAAAERLVADARASKAQKRSTALFALAERYCRLHAAASCVHHWAQRRAGASPFFREGEWVAAAIARLLGDERPMSPAIAQRLFEQVRGDRWLSHDDVPAP
jgi:alkylation response protein AidB-like acyl-CoA dehydrogenase